MRAMTLLPWSDHQRAHGIDRGARTDDERFVFSRPVRQFLSVYVAVAVLASLTLAPASLDERGYFEAFLLVTAVCLAPGVFIAWRAARRAPHGDRFVWRLWVTGFAIGCLVTVQFLATGDAGFEKVQQRAIGAAIIGAGLLVVANTLMLRLRSGQRSVLIDVADIAMAMAAVVAPLALIVGEAMFTADARWYAVSAAIYFLGALYGTGVAVVLYLRVRPEDRVVARYGVIFGAITLGSSAAQVVIGADDFGFPPGPFLAAHALCTGFGVIFLAHSTRRSSTGLERLPARAQVRRRPGVTLLVLVSLPVMGVLVMLRRDDEWAVLVALGTAAVLVSLFCLRSVLAAHETRLLYRDVERSADERAELLTDVLALADADRHRAATHLHRQSVQLYAALSTVVEPVAGDDRPTAAARVAEHLRDDLGRQSDDLRRFALAVRPTGDGPPTADSFTTLLRVQLDALYPDGGGPRLAATVDPDLVLDWTDEAVLVRIAEHGIRVLCRRAPDAVAVEVCLGVDARGIALDLRVDGPVGAVAPRRADLVIDDRSGVRAAVVIDPVGTDDDDLAPIRAGAELLGGTVEVLAVDAAIGLCVRVPIGAAAGPMSPPRLRAVD